MPPAKARRNREKLGGRVGVRTLRPLIPKKDEGDGGVVVVSRRA